jgi:hypothetical protein
MLTYFPQMTVYNLGYQEIRGITVWCNSRFNRYGTWVSDPLCASWICDCEECHLGPFGPFGRWGGERWLSWDTLHPHYSAEVQRPRVDLGVLEYKSISSKDVRIKSIW